MLTHIKYGQKYWHGIIFGSWRNQACIANFNPPTLFYCIKRSRCLNLLEHVLFFKHVLSMSFTSILRLKNANHFTKDVSLPWQLICFPPVMLLFPSAYASLVFDSSRLHCPINSVHMSLNKFPFVK